MLAEVWGIKKLQIILAKGLRIKFCVEIFYNLLNLDNYVLTSHVNVVKPGFYRKTAHLRYI